MKALSTLSILPQTKTEIKNFTESIKAELDDGYVDPLLFQQQLTSLKNIVDSLSKDQDIKEMILFEASKYGEKTIDFNGSKITKKNITRYDFSGCGDSKWSELKSKAVMAAEELKGRESFLKSLKDTFVDTVTGETIQPPKASISESLSVTLQK